MSASAQWSDLGPRVTSGIAMAVAGAIAVWAGGWIFLLLACAVCGAMAWETAQMFGGKAAGGVAVMAVVVLALAALLPGLFALPLLLAAGFVAAGQVDKDAPVLFGVFSWVMIASFALVLLREELGVAMFLWLVLVVIVSDVAGYFAGRMFGGPKFWPKVSPKKTWSGTLAGWAGAAVIGLIFAAPTGLGMVLVPISVLVSFAGQMGDIGESAIKRRQGIKDSSSLIPGHGGVFDRFDAMLGAAAMAMLLWLFGGFAGAA